MVTFDLVEHQLRLRSSGGEERRIGLSSRPVADFYGETMMALDQLGIEATIDPRPNEVDPAIPFPQDDRHATYDPEAAELFWRQLLQADRVLGGWGHGPRLHAVLRPRGAGAPRRRSQLRRLGDGRGVLP